MPGTPPGRCSAKMMSPARIGKMLVSRVETPAVARVVPRWNESWSEMKARPWQAGSSRANMMTGLVPPTAALVTTSPAE